MAIRNFISEGTYTKIEKIDWGNGYPMLVMVMTYEEPPSKQYVPFVDTEVEDENGDKVTITLFQEPEAKPMTENKINLAEVLDSAVLWEKWFGRDKITASGSNIHKQMYKYLLSTPLFAGAISDE